MTQPTAPDDRAWYPDVVGGVTTFFTMAYIVVVNPAILSTAGVGLTAFFAFTIVLQNKVPWQTALGMVFWAGVLFLLVSVTQLREQIALAIPASLRKAAAAGIGLLLTFIGLRNAGVIVGDPATLVRMGTLDHRAVFLLLGILVAAVLMKRGNPFAFLAAIFSAT